MADNSESQKQPSDDRWHAIRQLSLKEIEQEINIQGDGLKDGNNNHPATRADEWSMCEHQIIQVAENRIQDVHDHARQDRAFSQSKLDAIRQSNGIRELGQIIRGAEVDYESTLLRAEPELESLKRDEIRQTMDLNFFKGENNLRRKAESPESPILHFGILSVIFLAECLGNMYFFREATELGLLGGFFLAALVSTVNVGLSYIVGMFGIPQLAHTHYKILTRVTRRTAGALMVIIYSIVIISFHFTIAHFRDLLVSDPKHAAVLAIARVRADMLGLETLDSILVLLLGLVIALIALWEGYKHDDPYPGYGAKDRAHKNAESALKKKREEITNSMTKAIKATELKANDLYDKRERQLIEFGSRCRQLDGKSKRYQAAILNAQKVTNIAIELYRENNRRVRNDDPPSYFTKKVDLVKEHSIDSTYFSLTTNLATEQTMKTEHETTFCPAYEQFVNGLPQKVQATKSRVQNLVDDAERQARRMLDSEQTERH